MMRCSVLWRRGTATAIANRRWGWRVVRIHGSRGRLSQPPIRGTLRLIKALDVYLTHGFTANLRTPAAFVSAL